MEGRFFMFSIPFHGEKNAFFKKKYYNVAFALNSLIRIFIFQFERDCQKSLSVVADVANEGNSRMLIEV